MAVKPFESVIRKIMISIFYMSKYRRWRSGSITWSDLAVSGLTKKRAGALEQLSHLIACRCMMSRTSTKNRRSVVFHHWLKLTGWAWLPISWAPARLGGISHQAEILESFSLFRLLLHSVLLLIYYSLSSTLFLKINRICGSDHNMSSLSERIERVKQHDAEKAELFKVVSSSKFL